MISTNKIKLLTALSACSALFSTVSFFQGDMMSGIVCIILASNLMFSTKIAILQNSIEKLKSNEKAD